MTGSTRARIGLFYGSSTCYTEMAGEKIRQQIGTDKVDFFNVADTPISECEFYHYLIFGIPTWDYGELQDDWEDVWSELDTLNIKNKRFAIYGLGDQIGYPQWFQDAMGYLHDKLVNLGGMPVGYWPAEDYQFESSQALTSDQQYFVGLALDDENEFDKTDNRIGLWCDQILNEFGL